MNDPLIAAAFFDRLAAVPLTYWLLWIASALVSIALVVVLRTHWGQSRPLQKCAVLSLLVHALLAFLAMTIRVVVGDGGGGVAGAPIRVRLVEDSGAGSNTAGVSFDPPDDLEVLSPTSDPAGLKRESSSGSVDEDAEPKLPTEPPLLLAPALAVIEGPDAPSHSALTEATSPIERDTHSTADAAEVAPPGEPQLLSEAAKAVAPTGDLGSSSSAQVATSGEVLQLPSEQAPSPASGNITAVDRSVAPPSVGPQSNDSPGNAPAASAPYALRSAPGRLGLVELQGGNAQTEAAVAAALAWLARAQSNDGRWDANRFGAGQEQAVLGHDRGGAGRNADTGVSALALLAFLGAGHSHEQGDYKDSVRRGLEFLIDSQAVDGNLFGQSTFYAQMYCHSMATFALAEAQAMTGDPRFKPTVHKAIGYCVRAQNPATGGWRYRATYDTGDTSQLGWQLMALASAQRAGIEVPAATWSGIGRFLKSVRRGNYGGLASYRPDSPASTSMTAEAFYCRLLLYEVDGEMLDEQAAQEATNQLLASLPVDERMNLYYWYYATLALHKRQRAGEHAEAAWLRWNEALTAKLIGTQVADGTNAGSWNTNTVWGGYGGRVYTTAIAALCLEAYYRYAPLLRERSIATPRSSQDRPR